MKRTLFFMLLSAWLFSPAAWADEGEYDISLMNAGTLLDQIGIENIEKVYGLKVSGDLNGTDILTIRKMTNLRCLDMENANIVNGGLSYYADYITSQNTVGTYFFREKTNLEKIVLPKTVENIEDYSFSSCTGLTSVTIPENVTYICSDVFSGCTALRNLRIEEGTETLSLSTSSSSTPFDDCPLDTVYLGRNISYYSDYSPFKNKTTLVSLTIGKQVTSIGKNAFYKCTGLTSVTIPGSVTSIGGYAFRGCTGLTSVTIPNSVSMINESTFEDCSGLTEVIIGHSVETIAAAAFKGCSGLKKVTSLNTTPPAITTTTFDEETAKGATLYVPASCKNIYWLHPYWENFSSIENSDYEAYDFAEGGIYYHVNGSPERTVEVTYKTPSDRGYSGEVIIPEEVLHNDTLYTVTSISGYAFHDCKALAAITVGKNIARIGNGAFSGCTSLTSVTVGDNVATIDDDAFYCCSSLAAITIPNGVTDIGNDAFSGCTGLKNLRIEDGTKTLELGTSSSPTSFDDCPLDTVYLGRNIYYYNYYYDYSPFKNKTSLVSLTIGTQVTYIGVDAFYGCTGLKNLRIEDGTKTLVFDIHEPNSSNLFDGCPLDTVYLGRNYKCNYYDETYYYDLFKGKTSLVSLTIGKQVTSIGKSAFSGCKGLTEVTIPESITSIGKNAFYNCTGLTSVTAYNPKPVNIVYNEIPVFDGVDYETCKLYVLAGSVSTYKAAEGWKEFGTILPIEGYVPETGKDFIPVTVTPTDSAEVEALKTIILEFAETPSLVGKTAALLNEAGTLSYLADLAAGEGNTLVVTLKCDTLTAAGTYKLTIPEGAFGDADFADDPTVGHCNPELVYTYTIKEPEPVEPDEPENPNKPDEPIVPDEPDEPSSITETQADAEHIAVYNLQGVLVLETDDADDLKTLQNGAYIVNGKTMIIAR